MSLADARKKALMTLGGPMAPKTSMNFPEALEAFLALDRWRDSSRKVIESSLRHFAWKRPLDKITHEDVAQALETIDGSSARAHALKDIRAFFNWCVPRYLHASPCMGLKMEAQPSRDRVLSDDELKRVWKAAEKIGGPFGTIVRLLILTGQRRTEIGSLRWEYVDGTTVSLPVTKNGRPHTFPIGDMAQSLLPSRGSGYVFPSAKVDGPYNGYTNHQKSILKESKTTGWTLHDLRRTFATNLAVLGVPIHVTEKLLNHISGTLSGVAGIYNRHSYFSEMKDAVKLYEAHLQQLLKD